MSNTLIFKIVTAQDWDSAKSKGFFQGSKMDQKDGYIHSSTAEQVADVKDKFFSGITDLVLLSIDPAQIQDTLKWEKSPSSEKIYPHIYGILPLSAVIKEEKMD